MVAYRLKKWCSLAIVASALLLGGCGGGGGGGGGQPSNPPSVKTNGKAVDGYIAGAVVVDDKNDNGVEDSGEANVTTDASGNFTFPPGVLNPGDSLFLTGGIDLATGLPFEGRLSGIYEGGEAILSPVTTYLHQLVKSGESVDDAKKKVSQLFHIDVADVTADPMKNPDTFIASEKIMSAVELMGQTAGDVNETTFRVALETLVESDLNLTEAANRFCEETKTDVAPKSLAAGLESMYGFIDDLGNSGNGDVDPEDMQAVLDETVEDVAQDVENNETNVTLPEPSDAVTVAEAMGCVDAHFSEILGQNSSPTNITDDLDLSRVKQCEINGTVIELHLPDAFDTNGSLKPQYSDWAGALGVVARKKAANASRNYYLAGPRNANHPPVAEDFSVTTNEDNGTTFSIEGNVSDEDGDAVTLVGVSAQHDKNVSFSGNIVTYVPFPNFNGTDTLIYTVKDSWGDEANGTVTVTVSPVDDPPILYQPAEVNISEDGAPETVELNATDVDNDPADLNYSITINTSGQEVVVDAEIQGNVVTITPLPNKFGTTAILAKVTDPAGLYNTKNIIVHVAPVPDTAAIGGDKNGTVVEDGATSVSGELNVTDPDPGEAAMTPETNETVYGTFALQSDGKWSFTLANDSEAVQSLAEGESVTLDFPVHSVDGTGTDIQITIVGSNDAPVAQDFAKLFSELNVTKSIDLSPYVADEDNDTLELAGAVNNHDNVGSIDNVSGLTISYTPKSEGADTITYTVTDGHVDVNGTITITVSNGIPVDVTVLDGQTTATFDREDGDMFTFSFQNGASQIRGQHFLDLNGTWTRFDALENVGNYAFDNGVMKLAMDDGNYTVSDVRRVSLDGSTLTIPVDEETNETVSFGQDDALYRASLTVENAVPVYDEPFTWYQPWNGEEEPLHYDSLAAFMSDFSIGNQVHWFQEWDEENQQPLVSYAFADIGENNGTLVSTDDNATVVGTWEKVGENAVMIELGIRQPQDCDREVYGLLDGTLMKGDVMKAGCTEELVLYDDNATQTVESVLAGYSAVTYRVPEDYKAIDPIAVSGRIVSILSLEDEGDYGVDLEFFANNTVRITTEEGPQDGNWSIDNTGTMVIGLDDGETFHINLLGDLQEGTFGIRSIPGVDEKSLFIIKGTAPIRNVPLSVSDVKNRMIKLVGKERALAFSDEGEGVVSGDLTDNFDYIVSGIRWHINSHGEIAITNENNVTVGFLGLEAAPGAGVAGSLYRTDGRREPVFVESDLPIQTGDNHDINNTTFENKLVAMEQMGLKIAFFPEMDGNASNGNECWIAHKIPESRQTHVTGCNWSVNSNVLEIDTDNVIYSMRFNKAGNDLEAGNVVEVTADVDGYDHNFTSIVTSVEPLDYGNYPEGNITDVTDDINGSVLHLMDGLLEIDSNGSARYMGLGDDEVSVVAEDLTWTVEDNNSVTFYETNGSLAGNIAFYNSNDFGIGSVALDEEGDPMVVTGYYKIDETPATVTEEDVSNKIVKIVSDDKPQLAIRSVGGDRNYFMYYRDPETGEWGTREGTWSWSDGLRLNDENGSAWLDLSFRNVPKPGSLFDYEDFEDGDSGSGVVDSVIPLVTP
ncbi:Ig-like domain-containing protein [Hydrogenimonas sp. SS33]|uniref:Ig-like domain-containing protein n=1 Tax=Hydrogenimonas leucolamina TaxID=2954236 RepID=UPI00336C2341